MGPGVLYTFPQKSRNDRDDDDGFNYKSGNYRPYRIVGHDAAAIPEESQGITGVLPWRAR